MQVSEVNIHLIKPQGGLIAFASLVIDDSLFLSGIGIHRKLEGDGYRLTYPTRKAGQQSFEVFHPINRGTGIAIEQAVIAALKDVLNRLDCDAGYDSSDATAQ
jgi:DNA-binding cell septation regulator SpoVG